MFENPIFLIGISTVAAAIPVAIWLYIFFKKEKESKKVLFLVFFLGCLTAPALLGLQYVWDIFPRFNLATFVEESITTQSTMFIAMFVLFGAMEEIIKHYVITIVDKKTLLIKTIGDAIRYSLAAALGFSFTENIYYLVQFWPSIGLGELIGMYIFRSIFTMCAHMIFSGVFGYYYGIGKFSIDINKQKNLTGKKSFFTNIVSKLFNLPKSQAFQQQIIVKGLFIAIFIHAVYNYLLQYNITLPVLAFVVLGFLYLRYLLKRKAGHLILTTDVSSMEKSTMAKKDEDVAIELLGMWFNDKRYPDVIHVCERLLERDPDNNVVKLFKAKAMDKLDDKDTYKKILGNILKSKNDLSQNDKNIITKHLTEKAEFEQTQNKIKEQLKKEGKELKTLSPKASPPPPPKKDENSSTFKIDL